ncbi:MAG: hypothetical protein WBN83_08935 [Desulfoprunum sp.]|uniref:hypothetical protein n=1 Tax=Desulfoprunum sp. TaxID=2020866 RepID=UPI003C7748B8
MSAALGVEAAMRSPARHPGDVTTFFSSIPETASSNPSRFPEKQTAISTAHRFSENTDISFRELNHRLDRVQLHSRESPRSQRISAYSFPGGMKIAFLIPRSKVLSGRPIRYNTNYLE